MQAALIILAAFAAVVLIAGAYFLYIAKCDADARNEERNLPPDLNK